MKIQNVFIAHPKTIEEVNALKAFMEALKIRFEVARESPYDPAFVSKIQKSRQDYQDGKGTVLNMDELNNLWK
jgi:hypothetical protein